MKKLPPLEKVFEAWTAIADNRVELDNNGAIVKSSDGTKAYKVFFDGLKFASNDNATFWQGYPGYPVIAVLMLQHKLPLDKDEVQLWKDVNWKEINTRNRNNYAKAVEDVAEKRNINLEQARNKAKLVLDQLEKLPIEIKRKI